MRSGEVEVGLVVRVVLWGVKGARIAAPREERAGVGLEGWRVDGRADDGGAGSTIARTATPTVQKDRNGSIGSELWRWHMVVKRRMVQIECAVMSHSVVVVGARRGVRDGESPACTATTRAAAPTPSGACGRDDAIARVCMRCTSGSAGGERWRATATAAVT